MEITAKDVAEKLMKIVALGFEGKNNSFKLENDTARITKGFSERQLEILFRIYLLEQNSVTLLAESMLLSKSTVSIILNKLIEKKYVTRNYPRQDEDKRRVYFYITDEGIKLLNELSAAKVSEIWERYKTLSPDGKKLFNEAMEIFCSMCSEETIKFQELMEKIKGCQDKTQTLHLKGVAALAQIYTPVLKSVFGEECAVTEKQFKVLVSIYKLKLNTVTKLEKFFYTSGSSISIIVQRLEKSGFLYKDPNSCEEDRRITYLELTEKGVNVLIQLYNTLCSKIETACLQKSSEEKEKLNTACDKLLQAVAETNKIWR